MCRQVKFEQHTTWKQINKHINFLKDLPLDSQEIDGIEGVTTHEIIEIFWSNMLLSLRNMQNLWTKIFCQYTLTDFYMIGILAKNGLTTFVFKGVPSKKYINWIELKLLMSCFTNGSAASTKVNPYIGNLKLHFPWRQHYCSLIIISLD